MRVIATDRGYDNVRVREVGEEFEVPEGSSAPWFSPLEAQPKAKAPKAKAEAKPAADAGDIA